MELPKSLEDVAGWAEAIRSERINETGRRIVDLIELHVRTIVSMSERPDFLSLEELKAAGSRENAIAKLTAEVSKLFGYALKADAGEHHREMHELREKADRLQRRGDRLEMH